MTNLRLLETDIVIGRTYDSAYLEVASHTERTYVASGAVRALKNKLNLHEGKGEEEEEERREEMSGQEEIGGEIEKMKKEKEKKKEKGNEKGKVGVKDKYEDVGGKLILDGNRLKAAETIRFYITCYLLRKMYVRTDRKSVV